MSSTRSSKATTESDVQCVICTENIEIRGVAYECSVHLYCHKCISTWVEQSPKCPVCRTLITRILKRKITDPPPTKKDWEGVPIIKLTKAAEDGLGDELQDFEDAADDTFSCSESSPSSDDDEIDSDEVVEESTEDSSPPPTPLILKVKNNVHSYYDDNLSREPTFTGRKRGDDDDDEHIAFSLIPGEVDLPQNVSRKRKDTDYVPGDDDEEDSFTLRGAESASSTLSMSLRRKRGRKLKRSK